MEHDWKAAIKAAGECVVFLVIVMLAGAVSVSYSLYERIVLGRWGQ